MPAKRCDTLGEKEEMGGKMGKEKMGRGTFRRKSKENQEKKKEKEKKLKKKNCIQLFKLQQRMQHTIAAKVSDRK